jgi:hypothetical protein
VVKEQPSVWPLPLLSSLPGAVSMIESDCPGNHPSKLEAVFDSVSSQVGYSHHVTRKCYRSRQRSNAFLNHSATSALNAIFNRTTGP